MTQKHVDHDKRLKLYIAFGVALISLLALFAGAFEPAEDGLAQQRARMLNRAPTGEIAIVEIDAKSLASFKSWPWSRQLHARLVDRLHHAGAAAIAFDVDFSAPSEPKGDKALAQSIRDAAPVILPIFQQRLSDQASSRQMLASRPAAILDAAWVGGVNIFPGSDGLVREYPAATFIDGNVQPSLATLLVDNSAWGDRTFQPDWSIDARRIPRFSFVDVLNGTTPKSQIAGKRILIGATAVELGDRYTTPRFGVIPGVVVQALAAESLLQDRAIVRSGLVPTSLALLAVVLLLGTGTHSRPLVYAGKAGATLATILLAPLAIQAAVPVSVDSAAVLCAAIGCIFGWLAIELRRRVRLRNQTDADSGLPNRLMLERALEDGDQAKVVLVTASIERFEIIRDGVGTAAVSELARECASRITACVQAKVFRIAPDTLAWVLPSRTPSLTQAQIELVEGALRRPIATQAGPVDVVLTFGLDGGEGSCLLRIERALAAIGRARTAGHSYLWYENDASANLRQLSLMGELREGIAQGDVFLVYQPKLSLKSGQICDAEALVRWKHPIDGFVSPDSFIPLAEATGVVRDLTRFALETALAACSRWNAAKLPMRVAVNVSAADIATDEFVGCVDGLLAAYAVDPTQLALEITESAIIRSPEMAISVLGKLRDRGIRLSIDDYGTGQSTLSYLKQLPVHELKIDKSFVTSLCRSSSDMIMVRSTINLAHDLGIQVVAEGIEDQATLAVLSDLGCDYGQGYFIGKPMQEDALSALAQAFGSQERLRA